MGSKVLGTLCFPFCLRENLVQAKTRAADDDDTHERHTDTNRLTQECVRGEKFFVAAGVVGARVGGRRGRRARARRVRVGRGAELSGA